MNQLQNRTEILFGLKQYKLIVTALHSAQKYILDFKISKILNLRNSNF